MRSRRKVECEHPDRPHYARGLCRACYERFRRRNRHLFTENYVGSEKDKERRRRYEQKEKRKKQKAEWMRRYRAKLRRLTSEVT